MKPVFTSDEMKRCDTRAIEEFLLPGIALMENASMGAVEILEKEKGAVVNKRFFILCGPGNNGGDGFAIARHLVNRFAEVVVFSLKKDEEIKGDAATNLAILRKMEAAKTKGLSIIHVKNIRTLEEALADPPDVILDALLGTGLNAPVSGIVDEILELLHGIDVPVLAVDIPTGINADNGLAMGNAVMADMTVTMGGLKRGLLFADGKELSGDIHVADIGTPGIIYQHKDFDTHLVESEDIALLLPWRSQTAHKYEVGSVFVIAGSTGLTGAAAMASEATLRAGAGIVKLGIPASLNAIVETKLTEVMTVPLPETINGTHGIAGYEDIMKGFSKANAGIIGPGLGRNGQTLALVRKVITSTPVPMVIDADALYALGGHLDTLKESSHRHILTPHYGEFCRMTGMTVEELMQNPVAIARSFAKEYKVILVLKGAPTITAVPEGSVYINSTGNAGMATAGSGDVLTGLIAGFLVQCPDDWAAVIAAVCIHGAAGDAAADAFGELSLLATDILANIPTALRKYFT